MTVVCETESLFMLSLTRVYGLVVFFKTTDRMMIVTSRTAMMVEAILLRS